MVALPLLLIPIILGLMIAGGRLDYLAWLWFVFALLVWRSGYLGPTCAGRCLRSPLVWSEIKSG
jgi:hypothetical protein